jgi:hypothetical protein
MLCPSFPLGGLEILDMDILKGLGFFFFTVFILLNVARGIIPCIILIGASAYFFPWWYAVMISGLCISACFGRSLSRQTDFGDMSMLQMRFGVIFDALGNAIAIIGLLIGMLSWLFT